MTASISSNLAQTSNKKLRQRKLSPLKECANETPADEV
jgi:hypothetical protein